MLPQALVEWVAAEVRGDDDAEPVGERHRVAEHRRTGHAAVRAVAAGNHRKEWQELNRRESERRQRDIDEVARAAASNDCK